MILALAVSGIGILLGTILTISKNQITALVDSEIENLGKDEAGNIQQWLDTHFSAVRSVAQSMEAYDQIEPAQRRFFYNLLLKQLAETNPEIVAAWTCWEPDALDGEDSHYANTPGTDKTGRFISYWARSKTGVELSPLVDYEVSGAGDYYLIPRQTGNETIVEPYFYNINGTDTLIASLAVPVKKNGRIIAVAGVDIDLSRIQSGMADIRPYEGSSAAVFSNGGLVVGHFDSSHLGKSMTLTEGGTVGPYLNAFVEAVKGGVLFSFLTEINDNGIKSRFKIISIPFSIGKTTTPWALAIGIPQDVVNEPVYFMLRISVIISVIMLLAIAAAAFLIARSISLPLKNMTEVFSGIGEGDLTRRLDIKRKDEIGAMAKALNGTLEKITGLIFTIKDRSAVLFDIGSELAGNMTETAAAINEITANIRSIEGQVITQSASVAETNTVMEQITVNIEKLNNHVDQQGESVARSSSGIEEMLANIQSVSQTLIRNAANVKGLIEAAEIGRGGLNEVAADIQEIARESEGLLEINAVMQNIASQTNLLSMNAAIEAAHAGEAGKGFAVVADEIRKLAESSGEQSKTISAVLKKIKDSIDKIISSNDSVLNKFSAIDDGVRTVSDQEENIRNAMEEQSAGSRQILEAVSRLNEITRVVGDGSAQMREESGQIIQAIRNLEAVSREISGGMNEMAVGADQINTAVNRVNEISGQNKESIDVLVKEVSRFKVE
jgi:methyl-accepting chemotaxis protein